MSLLQIIAAHISQIDILHFHTGFDDLGYLSSLETFKRVLPSDNKFSFGDLLSNIVNINYNRGVSDGN